MTRSVFTLGEYTVMLAFDVIVLSIALVGAPGGSRHFPARMRKYGGSEPVSRGARGGAGERARGERAAPEPGRCPGAWRSSNSANSAPRRSLHVRGGCLNHQPAQSDSMLKGRRRIRLPVAAKIAFATAGAIAGV